MESPLPHILQMMTGTPRPVVEPVWSSSFTTRKEQDRRRQRKVSRQACASEALQMQHSKRAHMDVFDLLMKNVAQTSTILFPSRVRHKVTCGFDRWNGVNQALSPTNHLGSNQLTSVRTTPESSVKEVPSPSMQVPLEDGDIVDNAPSVTYARDRNPPCMVLASSWRTWMCRLPDDCVL